MSINATRFAAFVFLCLAALGYIQANSFLAEAAIFPKMILGLMFFLCVLLIFRSYKVEEYKVPANVNRKKQVLCCAAILLVCTALIHVIGYYIASSLFIVSIATVLRFQNKLIVLPVALAFPVLIYFCFEVLLKIPVPPIGG